MTTGVLLTNLGTPENPGFWAVRRYLKEFLSDPRVIDLPRWKWLPILNGIVLNIRPLRSGKNYQKIWTPEGSPLWVYSRKIEAKLQAALPGMPIALGMRYAEPSLKSALLKLRAAKVEKLIILPLYPQYSATTTATTLDKVVDLMRSCPAVPELHMVNHYYQNPLYIKALADSVRQHWKAQGQADKLVLSYHGLPERYVTRGDPYYTQCQQTTALLQAALKLADDQLVMTFQSRVGFEKWLEPATQDTLIDLAKQGTKNVAVLCPGFSCDCLETLEEIKLQNRDFFLENGGEDFEYIPCLNDSEAQIDLLVAIISSATSAASAPL